MTDEKKIVHAASDYADKRCKEDEELSFNQLLDAFEDGANWLLDSLWHDAKEEPKQDKWLLTERKVVNTFIHEVHITTSMSLTWDYLKSHNTVMVRWLYIDDLLKGGIHE